MWDYDADSCGVSFRTLLGRENLVGSRVSVFKDGDERQPRGGSRETFVDGGRQLLLDKSCDLEPHVEFWTFRRSNHNHAN